MDKHANGNIQPDFEIRIYAGATECGLLGLFFSGDDTVDVGMGIAAHILPADMATALRLCVAALESNTVWYDKEGLVNNPTITDEIKRGETS